MLDIKFVRENPDVVKQNIRNKFQDEKEPLVDKVIELDKENREIKQEVEALVQRETKSPNRSVHLWDREKEKKLKKLRNRLLHPRTRIENFPKRKRG